MFLIIQKEFKYYAFANKFDCLEVFDEITSNHFLSEYINPVVKITLTDSDHDFKPAIKI